jgi:hypothetical protein
MSPLGTARRGARPVELAVALALLSAVLLLLSVEFLAKIVLAAAGVPAVEVVERPLAVEGTVLIHGRKVGNELAGGRIEVGGEGLGGCDVASHVAGGGWETKSEI